MKKFGVGVFGIGWVAKEHVRAYTYNPHVRVVSLASRKKESAQRCKDELGLDCEILPDFESLLKRNDIDIIDICTPNSLHAQEAVAAALAGKQVVIEKPIAMNLEELKQVHQAIKKAGVKSQTGFVLRFNPYCRNLYEMLKAGAYGEPFYIETDYYHEIGPWWSGYNWGSNTKKGGPSATLVAGCHAVDLLSWWGGEVEEVFAYGTFGHRTDYEYEPTYAAVVKFKNGKIGKTGNSFENECPYFINVVIHGSNGSVLNEKFYTKKLFPYQSNWQTFNTIMPESGDVKHHPFREMVDDFVDALINDREPLAGIDASVRSHELCLAIDLSIETGKPVKLPLL